MSNLDEKIKRQFIEAFQSAIRKSENALAKMKLKNVNTTSPTDDGLFYHGLKSI